MARHGRGNRRKILTQPTSQAKQSVHVNAGDANAGENRTRGLKANFIREGATRVLVTSRQTSSKLEVKTLEELKRSRAKEKASAS